MIQKILQVKRSREDRLCTLFAPTVSMLQKVLYDSHQQVRIARDENRLLLLIILQFNI